MPKIYDIAIIGGGIVGMATAMAISRQSRASIIVIEAEDHLAAHQTGHNSGVIHSGLYYKPGSLKARNCVEGSKAMFAFCEEHNIPHMRCGKVVVATRESELASLNDLEKRGESNGLVGIRRLKAEEIKEYEPHAAGVAGLHVPQTGIVDYTAVTETYGEIVRKQGGEICLRTRVVGFTQDASNFILQTRYSDIHCRNVINCAGLQSDRIAKMCGLKPGLQILPFRGEYYRLIRESEELVHNLVYPVPVPQFPFLGVHFTRMIHGGIEAGPNAVLGFKREGYQFSDVSIRDLATYGLYIGFWRMALKHWKMGFGEMYRSLYKKAFVKAMQVLIPDIRESSVFRSGSGVRAQALEPTGALVDDFRIVEAEHMIHVLNAPSPAATASISIGQNIAEMATRDFKLLH